MKKVWKRKDKDGEEDDEEEDEEKGGEEVRENVRKTSKNKDLHAMMEILLEGQKDNTERLKGIEENQKAADKKFQEMEVCMHKILLKLGLPSNNEEEETTQEFERELRTKNAEDVSTYINIEIENPMDEENENVDGDNVEDQNDEENQEDEDNESMNDEDTP